MYTHSGKQANASGTSQEPQGEVCPKEFTQPRDLAVSDRGTITVRVHPGDVQVVGLTVE